MTISLRTFLLSEVLFAGAVTACCPIPAHAEIKCLDSSRSCEQPRGDCLYELQIAQKRVLLELFGDENLRNQAYAQAQAKIPGNDPASQIQRDQLAAKNMEKLVEDAVKDPGKFNFPKCDRTPAGGLGPTIPPFEQVTDADCNVHYVDDNGKVISDDLGQAAAACEEFNSAARVHELFHKSQCEKAKANPSGADRQALDNYIIEEMEAYYNEIEYLREERNFFKQHCSPTPAQSKEAREKASSKISRVTAAK